MAKCSYRALHSCLNFLCVDYTCFLPLFQVHFIKMIIAELAKNSTKKLDIRIAVQRLNYRDHQRSEWVGPGGTKVTPDSKFAE